MSTDATPTLEHRVWSALALLVVTGLYVSAGGMTSVALAAGGAIALSLALGGRAPLGVGVQRALAIIAGAAGAALALSSAQSPAVHVVRAELEPVWSAVAIGALLAATTRLFARAPEGGAPATFVLGLVAMVACGETRFRGWFGSAVLAFVVLSLLALRAGDRERAPYAKLRARDVISALGASAIAAALGLVITASLPPLAERANQLSLNDEIARSGFGEQLTLGSIDGMLQSDEVVLRLVGRTTDYVRGAVYDQYVGNQWRTSLGGNARTIRVPRRPRAGTRGVQAVVTGGVGNRYFLPLGASQVATTEGQVEVDRFGVVRASRGAHSVWFDTRPNTTPDFPPLPPTERDSLVPPHLHEPLGRLVSEWTNPTDTPRARALALVRHLRNDFTYSLHFRRRGGGDPLLDFLFDNRQGHCEYFASALALLLREAGVPARVAAGYRVSERNPISGHYIVRERDAHAWVEAHFAEGGWQTLDATPAGPETTRGGRPLGWLRALGDALTTYIARARAATPEFGWLELGILVVAVILGRAFIRWLRERRKRAVSFGGYTDAEAVPEELQRLLDALARAGVARGEAETLEAFARRLDEGAWRFAADTLREYAAYRYGGIGEGGAVQRALRECVARVVAERA